MLTILTCSTYAVVVLVVLEVMVLLLVLDEVVVLELLVLEVDVDEDVLVEDDEVVEEVELVELLEKVDVVVDDVEEVLQLVLVVLLVNVTLLVVVDDVVLVDVVVVTSSLWRLVMPSPAAALRASSDARFGSASTAALSCEVALGRDWFRASARAPSTTTTIEEPEFRKASTVGRDCCSTRIVVLPKGSMARIEDARAGTPALEPFSSWTLASAASSVPHCLVSLCTSAGVPNNVDIPSVTLVPKVKFFIWKCGINVST